MSTLDGDPLYGAAKDAASQYYRLVLLAGESGSGKSERLQQLATALNTEVVNVNLGLSQLLLDLTIQQRTMHLPKLLADVVNTGQAIVVVDNLEILFDVSLRQDPLRLLRGLSRNTTVVASWNGTANGDRLTYAEPGHPEYRSCEIADLTIIHC